MWKVVRIPAGDITILHYNFVVAKPLVIYKCKNYNATTIPFLLSCKLLNQLKDIESLIEDGGRGVAYQTYFNFSKNRSHLYR